MRYAFPLAVLAVLAVTLVPQATAREQAPTRNEPRAGQISTALLKRIARHRDATWRWERLMRKPRTPYGGSVSRVSSTVYRQWVLHLWLHRELAARRQAKNPPHKRQWLCIHHYEGSWTDPNAPYYGGLQMDRRVPAHVRPATPAGEGHRRPLDAARADVGGRARLPDARILALAEHGEILRIAVAADG